ncbi:MAG: hypothetical protein JNJ73_01620 [Hyphomonadaceae bacterium]|nr:hypothetical protein [Hyphomonadaceae bacterium]
MRVLLVFATGLALAACSAEPHPYPDAARRAFTRTCTAGDAICECMWEKITRAMPHEDYKAALERYEEEGLMEPRIARARTECLERHAQ